MRTTILIPIMALALAALACGGTQSNVAVPTTDPCQGLDNLTDLERAQHGCYVSGPTAQAARQAKEECDQAIRALNLTAGYIFPFATMLQDAKDCPGFDEAISRLADAWLAGQNIPEAARPALRPAAIALIAAPDPTAQATAMNELEQTLLLWLNAHRPPSRPVYVRPPRDPFQQFDLDRLNREVHDLQWCVNFGTFC